MIKTKTILNFIIIIIIYVTILKIFSPIIDHEFGHLDKNKSNIYIYISIISQIFIISIFWIFIHKFIKYILKRYLNIKISEESKNIIDIISAIVLIGLQKNLIDKLEYITLEHPYRKYF